MIYAVYTRFWFCRPSCTRSIFKIMMPGDCEGRSISLHFLKLFLVDFESSLFSASVYWLPYFLPDLLESILPSTNTLLVLPVPLDSTQVQSIIDPPLGLTVGEVFFCLFVCSFNQMLLLFPQTNLLLVMKPKSSIFTSSVHSTCI